MENYTSAQRIYWTPNDITVVAGVSLALLFMLCGGLCSGFMSGAAPFYQIGYEIGSNEAEERFKLIDHQVPHKAQPNPPTWLYHCIAFNETGEVVEGWLSPNKSCPGGVHDGIVVRPDLIF